MAQQCYSQVGTVTFITHGGETFCINADRGISVMQLATSNALPGIDAECGGSLSCATCHVIVASEWFERTGAPNEDEHSMLEFAEQPEPTSRLSCQIKYSDELDGLVVHIPESQ